MANVVCWSFFPNYLLVNAGKLAIKPLLGTCNIRNQAQHTCVHPHPCINFAIHAWQQGYGGTPRSFLALNCFQISSVHIMLVSNGTGFARVTTSLESKAHALMSLLLSLIKQHRIIKNLALTSNPNMLTMIESKLLYARRESTKPP